MVDTVVKELKCGYTSAPCYGPTTNLRDVFKVLYDSTVSQLGAVNFKSARYNGTLPDCVFPNLKLCLHRAFPETYPVSAQGWRNIGTEKPSKGTELTNDALSEALRHKTHFSKSEGDAFLIDNLQLDHFIQSGASYFQPYVGGELVVDLHHNAYGPCKRKRDLGYDPVTKKPQRFAWYITGLEPKQLALNRVSKWQHDNY